MDCGCKNGQQQTYTVKAYLKGKVADYTISDNVVETVCFERGLEPLEEAGGSDTRLMKLAYADLLKYIYLQPSTTKSYAIQNGTWSQKEGHTILSENDRKRLLAEMRKLYAECGEPESIPTTKPTIRLSAIGMRTWKRKGNV